MIFTKAKQAFLSGQINLVSDVVRIVLISAEGYRARIETDEFLSDIPAAVRVSTCAALESKSVDNGVFDAADTTFKLVAGGVCGSVVVYQDTGDEKTSRLIDYQSSGLGLPITPNGADIDLAFDNGALKIFSIL